MTKTKTAPEAEVTEESAGRILSTIYAKALEDIPKVSRSVDEFAYDYTSRYSSPEKAAKALAKYQILKCGTSGFITGIGGLITLPVAVPANIGSVLYVQMRMVAAIAKIGGYDVKSDQVQTLVYICLTGTAINDIAKEVGIKIGEKAFVGAVKKVPGEVLVKINQKAGFRLLTKFGEKGVINLGKLVPIAGGVIGGGFDVAATTVIARNAIRMFIDKEAPDGKMPPEESIKAAMDFEECDSEDGLI